METSGICSLDADQSQCLKRECPDSDPLQATVGEWEKERIRLEERIQSTHDEWKAKYDDLLNNINQNKKMTEWEAKSADSAMRKLMATNLKNALRRISKEVRVRVRVATLSHQCQP